MVGLFEYLKKTFTYSGEDVEDDESNIKSSTKKEFGTPRIDITNPLRRIKDIRFDTVVSIKNITNQEKDVITNYTKTLIYEAFYHVVEEKLHKNKPLVEAKLLFKRFLEDEVTDEAMYSDEDLLYIQTLVGYLKELKSDVIAKTTSREALLDEIVESKYLLNIIELYDSYYNLGMMKYLCDTNYIVCGYSYSNKGVVKELKERVNTPYFSLTVGDSIFYLLSEVQSLISDSDSYEDKRDYILSKLKPMVKRFVILNDISTRILYPAYVIFTKWLGISSTIGVIDTSNSTMEEVKQKVQQEVVEESTPKDTIHDALVEADVQEMMFETIEKEISTPIESLKKDSDFVTLYGPLASPANPDVDIDELGEAIQDINTMVENGVDLSMEEFKIFSAIKARYSSLLRDGGGS